MKVYVECQNCGDKIHLEDIRDRRTDYPLNFQLRCSNCGAEVFYSRRHLEAEVQENNTAGGAILGGAAGSIAGPIGVPIGAVLGGLFGQNLDQEEKEKLRRFYGEDNLEPADHL